MHLPPRRLLNGPMLRRQNKRSLLRKHSSNGTQKLIRCPTLKIRPYRRHLLDVGGSRARRSCRKMSQVIFARSVDISTSNIWSIAPPYQMLEEVMLASLRWVLDSDGCNFCRLVALTIKDIVGGHMVATEVNGKDLICTLRTLPMENDTSGPRQICLITVPPPQGLEGSSRLIFYSFKSRDRLLSPDTNYGQSVQSP